MRVPLLGRLLAALGSVEGLPRRPERGAALGFGPSAARVGRLARKELSEILRDRRTILTLVLMPLLLYPLLSFAFRQFLPVLLPPQEQEKQYRIGVAGQREKRFIEQYLALGAEVEWWRVPGFVGVRAPALGNSPFVAAGPLLAGRAHHEPQIAAPKRYDYKANGSETHPAVEIVDVDREENFQLALGMGKIDVAIQVRFAAGQEPEPGKQLRLPPRVDWHNTYLPAFDWRLIYLEYLPRSRETASYVEQRCALANARRLRALLSERDLNQSAVPVRIVPLAVEPDAGPSGPTLSLTALVPLILILMTITGAVYPAIDLTAGERERGTLEILVSAPVPRMALLFAKYIAVVTVAMLTATINLAMMLVMLEFNEMTSLVFKAGVTVQLVLQLFFLLLLFAAFFSAVLLVLTSFARSFKEAQAYLIPLMLAALGPGVLGMMPGLELSGVLTVTPLLNIVLLARDLSEGQARLGVSTIVVVSTLIYALAAITAAARIFGAEAVLFSEQSGWSDLFRRPAEKQPHATVAGALFCLALLFPIYFLVVSFLPRNDPNNPGALLLYQLLGTLLMFVGLPLLACWLGRIRLESALQTRPPPEVAWPAAFLLAAAAVPAIYYVTAAMRDLDLTFLTPEQEQQIRTQMRGWRMQPAGMLAAVFALTGAAEELFFRGFLFSALRSTAGRRWTIIASALLFGLFHCLSLVDRLVPSTLMGLLLGWVCWNTRSVWPGMLLHASYNAMFILLAYHQPVRRSTRMLQEIPLWWQLAALPAALVAFGLIYWFRVRSEPAAPPWSPTPVPVREVAVIVHHGVTEDGKQALGDRGE
jgi:membrane protease YdiL (CAAX protease family)/ABC-type Na+ efflux pump permease subunit